MMIRSGLKEVDVCGAVYAQADVQVSVPLSLQSGKKLNNAERARAFLSHCHWLYTTGVVLLKLVC